jgi:Xaa-Pro dipeptidase
MISQEQLTAQYLAHVAALQRRYDDLCARLGLDAVLLHSGVARPRSIFDDQFWPLRVVPHFAHWTPLAEQDAVLEIRPGRKPTLHRLVEQNFWEQPAPFRQPHVSAAVIAAQRHACYRA